MIRSTTREHSTTNDPAMNHNGTIRCAIYTRKSTEEGLEQEFNSLDAQRESAEAFIASQRHEGWLCLPDRYDDGGFSGGKMDRPALQRLFADIEAGGIDCVVVYKVDRMSRALLDFARIIDLFGKFSIFREEAITGMDTIGIGQFGRTNQGRYIQVAFQGRGRTNANRFVG